MPVRDSTAWQHAQVMRKIVNLDAGGRKIKCATLDCDRDAYEMFTVVQHEHLRKVHLSGHGWLYGDQLCEAIDAGVVEGIHRRWPFCSERHLNLFKYGMGPQSVAMAQSNGGHAYGSLPTGYHGSMQ